MPKCPRCKKQVPIASTQPYLALSNSGAPVSTNTSRASRWLWWGLPGIAILVVAAKFIATPSPPPPTPTEDETKESPPRAATSAPSVFQHEDTPVSDAPPATIPQPNAPPMNRADALNRLILSVENRRLQANVQVYRSQPNVIRLLSKHCTDPRLHRVIDRIAPSLQAVQFTTVQCFAGENTLAYTKLLED